MDDDKSFEQAMADAEAAFSQPEPEVETPEEDVTTEEAAPEETPEAPAETPEPELRSSALAAAARRERELRERQREIAEREERIKALEAQLEAKSAPETKSKPPLGGIDISGLSAQDIQALALAEELGEDTPDHVVQRVQRIHQEQRYKELERRLEQEKAQGKQEIDPRLAVRVEMKQAEIDSFVDSGVPSDYKMLSALSKDEPNEVKQAIEALVATHYKTTNQWLSAAAAAKTLEQELFNQYEKLSKLVGTKQPPASTETTQEPTTTSAALSDADLANHPDRAADADGIDNFMELLDRTATKFKNL